MQRQRISGSEPAEVGCARDRSGRAIAESANANAKAKKAEFEKHKAKIDIRVEVF